MTPQEIEGLENKSIVLIDDYDPENTKQYNCVIVGASVDIGICIMFENDRNGVPALVAHGPLSPKMAAIGEIGPYTQRLLRRNINIVAEYCSADVVNVRKLEQALGYFSTTKLPQCPYSM